MDVPYPQTPTLTGGQCFVVTLVNLFVPGLGTLLAGVMGGERLFARGLFQFLLTGIAIGWFWAQYTSIQCWTNRSRAARS